MQSERHELLEVRLGSGRVYLIPRAVLEILVHAYPVEACQLIVSASTTRGPLDPSGLPSEAGQGGGEVIACIRFIDARWRRKYVIVIYYETRLTTFFVRYAACFPGVTALVGFCRDGSRRIEGV